MPPCGTVVRRPLPHLSDGSFKMFKISLSDFGTVGMCRRVQARADEFPPIVTEGVVHVVYKGVTQASFTLIRRHKVSGSKWTFHHCVTRWHKNLGR